MKKTPIVLCVLLLTAFLTVTAAAAEEPVLISTAEEFMQIFENPEGSYRLTADLDFGGSDYTAGAFSGKLDGNGHTIYNLRITAAGSGRAETVDGNAKVYDTALAGLFTTLTNAEVRNLTLRGVDVDVRAEENCYVAAVAGAMDNAKIENCRVLDARIRLTSAVGAGNALNGKSCVGGVGGLVGFGRGTVTGCTVDAVLRFCDECTDSVRCEQFLGGILACGYGKIESTAVTLRGYCECRGYAHNGGLVGMYYVYNRGDTAQPISGCSISGFITFFEDNRDRRAYCEAFVGELLTWTNLSGNTPSFERKEVFDYATSLDPEACAEPVYTENVTPATCTEVGYTEHTCSVCGNAWRDSFVPYAHEPGDWVVAQAATYTESGVRALPCRLCGATIREVAIAPHVDGEWITAREADYNVEGLRQLLCAECGDVLEEEILPAKIPAAGLTLSEEAVEIYQGETFVLAATIIPENVDSPIVHYKSSDEHVAKVEANGTVRAIRGGEAVITATSADGFAESSCAVTVKLTFSQWIREYILFGWLMH